MVTGSYMQAFLAKQGKASCADLLADGFLS
jgi:hypothetical protein